MDWNEQEVYAFSDDEHTPDNPYCADPSCWCHTDVAYHETVEYPTYSDGEIDQAYAYFELSR